MEHTEIEAYKLIDACNENINSGEIDAAASYVAGVRDALLWMLEGTSLPYIGREE